MTSVGIMASGVSVPSVVDVLSEPFNNLTSWTAAGSNAIVGAGRTLSGAQVSGTTSSIRYTIPALNESDTVTMGFAWRTPALPGAGVNNTLVEFKSDANATSHNLLTVQDTGALRVNRSSTQIAISSTGIVTTNTWYYVEVQIRLHDSAGFVIVKVNGTEVINSTALDTKNAGTKTVYDTIQLGVVNASSGGTHFYDDLYITTGAGATFKGDQVLGPTVGFKASQGTQVATTAAATLVITTLSRIDVGDLVVVRVASDNASATTPTFTCSDSASNTYTTHRQGAVNATAAAGVAGAIMCSKATTAVPVGGTITVTLSLSTLAARAAYAETFVGFNNTTRSTPVGSSGTTSGQTSGTSGTVNVGDLCLGFTATETRGAFAYDGDSVGGDWQVRPMTVLANAATGTDNTRVTVGGQYKIPTVTTAQSFDPAGPTTEWVCGLVVLQAA